MGYKGGPIAYQYWDGLRTTNYAMPKTAYTIMLACHVRIIRRLGFDSLIAYNACSVQIFIINI